MGGDEATGRRGPRRGSAARRGPARVESGRRDRPGGASRKLGVRLVLGVVLRRRWGGRRQGGFLGFAGARPILSRGRGKPGR